MCVLCVCVQMGAYHTIELELNRKFTLAKKVWDSIVLDRIGKFNKRSHFNIFQSVSLQTILQL